MVRKDRIVVWKRKGWWRKVEKWLQWHEVKSWQILSLWFNLPQHWFTLMCDLISLLSICSNTLQRWRWRRHTHLTMCRLTLHLHANTLSVCGRLPRCRACITGCRSNTDVTAAGSKRNPWAGITLTLSRTAFLTQSSQRPEDKARPAVSL